jgi:hypothetical protein
MLSHETMIDILRRFRQLWKISRHFFPPKKEENFWATSDLRAYDFWSNSGIYLYCQRFKAGTDVKIYKLFSPQKLGKNTCFFQNTNSCLQKLEHNIFLIAIFRRKFAKLPKAIIWFGFWFVHPTIRKWCQIQMPDFDPSRLCAN